MLKSRSSNLSKPIEFDIIQFENAFRKEYHDYMKKIASAIITIVDKLDMDPIFKSECRELIVENTQTKENIYSIKNTFTPLELITGRVNRKEYKCVNMFTHLNMVSLIPHLNNVVSTFGYTITIYECPLGYWLSEKFLIKLSW